MFISRGQPRKPGGVPRLPRIAILPHISFIPFFPLEHHLTIPDTSARSLQSVTRNSPSRFISCAETCAQHCIFLFFLICDLADYNEWGPKKKQGTWDNECNVRRALLCDLSGYGTPRAQPPSAPRPGKNLLGYESCALGHPASCRAEDIERRGWRYVTNLDN